MQLPSNLSVSQKKKISLLYKSDFLETSQHSEFKSTPIKDHSTINPLKVKKKIKTFSVTILKHGWFQETHVTKPILAQLCFQAPAYLAVNDLIAKAPTTKITLDNYHIYLFSNVDKEMQCPTIQNLCLQMGLSALTKPQLTNMKSLSTGRVLKPSSLQLCVQMNEPEKVFKSRVWNSVQSENSSSVSIWDYSDAEDTPTSSWSTLPNRPLPLDIGRFTCVILKEIQPGGLRWGWGGSIVLTLYQSHFIGVVVKKIGGWT
ncbi:hypothetical protein NC652_009635 [Populus alba x Populus x berolinensis]|nr:hypothetical protein NC652_009635 [Populus alba x Populus x berolinensis]